jgi:glycyl-tRNA synthetase
MFVNFKNVIDTTRARLPFGLAQIGKAFRNEITPGNFLFRTREFEQMEIQMFVKPEESEEQFSKFIEQAGYFWKEIIGLKEENMRTRDHGADELAHYARQAKDYEFKFPR